MNRLKQPVPKVIRLLQKIAAAVFSCSTVVTTFMAAFPETGVPKWVPMTILGAGLANHVFLQLFTEEDNK